jgi:hypothetical protein
MKSHVHTCVFPRLNPLFAKINVNFDKNVTRRRALIII